MTLKRITALLFALLCFASFALAEDLPLAEEFAIPLPEMVFDPIPWDVDVSPNLPIQSCYLPNHAGYHDDSLDIQVETFRRETFADGVSHKNTIWVVRIAIKDPSQLRTTTANPKRPNSQSDDYVSRMAKRVGAVLAINGDYFCYHTEGIVWRNGVHIRRDNPTVNHDILYIDTDGDFHIVKGNNAKYFQGYDGEILHAFCFGPGLVVDGEGISDQTLNSLSQNVGKNNLTQRIAFCQTGPLEYMVIATEGPEQDGSVGMTLAEMRDLCLEMGVRNAYNLDGGSSSSIVLNYEKINATNKARTVGDCIWFTTLVPGGK